MIVLLTSYSVASILRCLAWQHNGTDLYSILLDMQQSCKSDPSMSLLFEFHDDERVRGRSSDILGLQINNNEPVDPFALESKRHRSEVVPHLDRNTLAWSYPVVWHSWNLENIQHKTSEWFSPQWTANSSYISYSTRVTQMLIFGRPAWVMIPKNASDDLACNLCMQ